jgi:hypothetical protein
VRVGSISSDRSVAVTPDEKMGAVETSSRRIKTS